MNLAWEAAAAFAVGLFLVILVLQPLVSGVPAGQAPADDFAEPEDTPKAVALAALREIEFDRATGKLSDVDYEFLKARYTNIALAALRADDADALATGPGVVDLEALVAGRRRQLANARRHAAPGAPSCATCGPRPEADAHFCSSCGVALAATPCRGCGAAAVPGAFYCEMCGVTLAA